MQVLLPNVPEETVRALAEEAKRANKTVEEMITELAIERAVSVQSPRRFPIGTLQRIEQLAQSIGPVKDSVPLIREDRDL